MRAYHGDSELKARVMAELEAHAAADAIIQGVYWNGHRGCAVGCLTRDPHGGHEQYPERWGIPYPLADIEDDIFESLPPDRARQWPLRFMGAIRPGAELDLVWPRFALALLDAVSTHADPGTPPWRAAQTVAGLYQRLVSGDAPTEEEWTAAEDAAYDDAERLIPVMDAAFYLARAATSNDEYDATDALAVTLELCGDEAVVGLSDTLIALLEAA